MKISANQEELSNEISSKWVKNALEKKLFDKPLIQTFFDIFYWKSGFREPEILYATSPLAAQNIALDCKLETVDWRNVGGLLFSDVERRISNIAYMPGKLTHLIMRKAKVASLAKIHIELHLRHLLGFMYEEVAQNLRSAQSCSLYDFGLAEGFIKRRSGIIDTYCEYVGNSGVFLAICEASHVIVCPNPAKIKFNDAGMLHSEEGSTVSWDDGFDLHFLEGSPVSGRVVESSPNEGKNLMLLMSNKTSEIQREVSRRFGIYLSVRDFRIRVIDKWRSKWGLYELIMLEVPQIEGLKLLKMLNPSTGDWHMESVPQEITNCKEALAWRDGEAEYIVPKLLT